MAGSTLGKLFTCTTWGDIGGASIGVVVDGVPAGLALCENDIQQYLNRRKTGASLFAARKHESDFVTINSGVSDGETNGMPVSLTIMNSASKEAANLTGREAASCVAAGSIAVAILSQLGIGFCTYVRSIGQTVIDYEKCSLDTLAKSPLNMPDVEATAAAMEYLSEISRSSGAAESVVETVVMGLPSGIGSHSFGRIDSDIVKAVMSIGNIRNVEFDKGVKGGLSDGSELVVRAVFNEPTDAVSKDVVLAPKSCVVVESMIAMTLVDGLLSNMGSKMNNLKRFYQADNVETAQET